MRSDDKPSCRSCGAQHEPVCSYCGTVSDGISVRYGYQALAAHAMRHMASRDRALRSVVHAVVSDCVVSGNTINEQPYGILLGDEHVIRHR